MNDERNMDINVPKRSEEEIGVDNLSKPKEEVEKVFVKNSANKMDKSFEYIFNTFKRYTSGVASEVKKRRYYKKPSVVKKEKSKAARRSVNKGNKFGNRW